uniref:Protein phosphatase 1 regulatory subunit 15A n=1 Tax=Pygocentrus nattereri TaxID=42514 RepID=A0A3B4E2K8_PYGNA
MALFTTNLHHPLYYWCLPQAALYIPSVKNLVHSASMTRTNTNLPLSPYTGMPVLTMLEKIGLHLWEVIRQVIRRFMSVTELLNSKVFFMCAGETGAMMGKSKKTTMGLEAPEDEVVLSDWLDWESEEEEEDGRGSSDEEESNDDGDEEENEEDETKWSDEEDSDWSNDEGDSDASRESTELWESFFNNSDPYNPFYLFCPTGVKTESTDTTQNCTTSRPPVNEVQKSASADVRFSEEVTVHHLIAWSSASQAARDGSCWLELARDRERFRRRVERTGEVLNPCLTAEHRARVWDRLQRGAHSILPKTLKSNSFL